MDKLRHYRKHFKTLPAIERLQALVSLGIKLVMAAALGLAILEGEWTTVFVIVSALMAALLPWYLARNYHFYVPIGFEFIIVLFVAATLFLGEVHGFYTRFWWWDVVLHTGSGMAFGFIGFLILYSFYHSGRFDAPPLLIAFLAFSVSMAIGAVWEIFEFAMDSIFGLNMQKTGLVDTMWDLIVNTVGALVASVSGYLFLRYKRRGLGIFNHYLQSYFGEKVGRKTSI